MKRYIAGLIMTICAGGVQAGVVDMVGTKLNGLIGSGTFTVVAVIPTSPTQGRDMTSLDTQIWIYRDGAMWVCDYHAASKEESHCKQAQ